MSDCKCNKDQPISKKDMTLNEVENIKKTYIEEEIFDEPDDTPDIEYSSWIQIR